jgi:protoporphyrinogen oxidase
LRYRQAGRIVTVFEAEERADRRGHASVASRDRFLLALLEELELSACVRWDGAHLPGLRFGALTGGRGRIVETLRRRARALGVDMRLGTAVSAVSGDGTGFIVRTGSEAGEFDQVVLTVPSPVASRLLTLLADRERLELQNVAHVGIINVSFVLEARIGERYISRITRGSDQFALIEPDALMPPDGRPSVVYVSRALATNDELFRAPDRRVIENFARALPGRASIVSARAMRMPHAFAQDQLPSFKSSIPGLSIVNAAHMAGGRHHLERNAALATTVFRTLCAERIS